MIPTAVWLAFLLAFAGGAAVAAITRAIETSRLAIGPLAFYGNGALAVPAALMPVAIYALWSWLLRGYGGRAAVIASVAGLWIGFGAALSVVTYGRLGVDDLLFIAGNGLIWVGIPAALIALVLVVIRRFPLFASYYGLFGLVLLGLTLAINPLLSIFSYGLIAGPFTAAGMRADALRAVLLGVVLLALLLVAAIALPILFGSLFLPR